MEIRPPPENLTAQIGVEEEIGGFRLGLVGGTNVSQHLGPDDTPALPDPGYLPQV
jgi:hypothetical protein